MDLITRIKGLLPIGKSDLQKRVDAQERLEDATAKLEEAKQQKDQRDG